eukprot:m.36791 g.36791  ORF g.36791 m.36791 type:complete len:351 (-) comp7614_c0_seq1:1058-2110(-)
MRFGMMALAFISGGIMRRAMSRNPSVRPSPTTATSRPNEWSDGNILSSVGGCRNSGCSSFCHRCSCTDPTICFVCKASTYLLVNLGRQPQSIDMEQVVSGVCVHACPGKHAARGHGTFNRHCVPRGRTLHGQIAAIVKSSQLSGGALTRVSAQTAGDRNNTELCDCGRNCRSDSCRCDRGATPHVPGIPTRGRCSVCTNSYYNFLGGCFKTCTSIPGLRESGLSVIGRQCVVASEASGPRYELVHRGAEAGGAAGLMFSTATKKKHELFDMQSGTGSVLCGKQGKDGRAMKRCSNGGVVTLEDCQKICTETKRCRGVLYYRVAKRCRGFSSLGGVPVSAGIEADSYKRKT